MSEATDNASGTDRARSLLTKPFDDADAEPGGGLRRAALTAAAAAVAGGLAGAAQELLSRRSDGDEEEEPTAEAPEENERGEQDAEEPQAEAEEEPELEDDEPQAEGGDAARAEGGDEARAEGDDDEAEASVDEQEEPDDAEEQDEEDPDAEPDDEPEARSDDTDGDGRRDGASPGKAGELVRNARRQLTELLGAEPETVSAIRRNGDGWAVTFEVLEIRRIPESTDVLASYVVTLDDDGNLLDLQRSRRYRRAQVDEG